MMNGTTSPPRQKKQIFVGTFLHNTSLKEISIMKKCTMGVDEKGMIVFMKDVEGKSGGVQELRERLGWGDAEADVVTMSYEDEEEGVGFWFPGFVDTHIHASQYPNTGIFGKTSLLSWLEKYTFPLEASLSSLPKAATVYSHCITTTLRHGTTTAAYYATISAPSTSLLASLCLSYGQRAFIGRCNMDSDIHPPYYKDPSPSAAIASTWATINHISSLDPTFSLISPILTPRFAPSCTPSLLQDLGDLHRDTWFPIQTHLSENRAEIELVRQMFPDCNSYTHVYAKYGLLTLRTVLAHCCHLTPPEVELLKVNKCSVSHCPVSNSYLGSGVCPVRELLDEGITVGLGTDVSGGLSPSVLVAAREAGAVSRYRTCFLDDTNVAEVPAAAGSRLGDAEKARSEERTRRKSTEDQREAARQQRKDRLKLSTEETLYLATRGGAKALGLEYKVGGFEVGMEFDAQFIDLGKRVRYGTSLPSTGTENGAGGQGEDHESNKAGAETEELDRILKDLSRLGQGGAGSLPTVEGGRGGVQIWEKMGWEEILAKWVNCGDERNTRAVWVKGRLVSGGMGDD